MPTAPIAIKVDSVQTRVLPRNSKNTGERMTSDNLSDPPYKLNLRDFLRPADRPDFYKNRML